MAKQQNKKEDEISLIIRQLLFFENHGKAKKKHIKVVTNQKPSKKVRTVKGNSTSINMRRNVVGDNQVWINLFEKQESTTYDEPT